MILTLQNKNMRNPNVFNLLGLSFSFLAIEQIGKVVKWHPKGTKTEICKTHFKVIEFCQQITGIKKKGESSTLKKKKTKTEDIE